VVVDDSLTATMALDLVRRGDRSESYAFKHMLVCDALHAGLLSAQRTAVHLKIARELSRVGRVKTTPKGGTTIDPAAVFDTPADIFAPCALGGVINDQTIGRLRVLIVAGGANNQLEGLRHGQALRARGILYAPDYVINGGGMIQLALERLGGSREETEQRVRSIGDTLAAIYRMADAESIATNEAADRLVESKFGTGAAAAAA